MSKNQHLMHASSDELKEQNAANDYALVREIGAWSKKNFSYHNPWLGLIEEVGEIAHCLLKRAQGIRGYGDPEKFKTEFADALADFCIYAAHYADMHPKEKYNLDTLPSELLADEILSRLLRTLPELANPNFIGPSQLGIAVSYASRLAYMEGLDLREITRAVWEEVVSKRDWIANPQTAVSPE